MEISRLATEQSKALPLIRVFTKLKAPQDLANVQLVSKEWLQAARAPEVWRTLDLSGAQLLPDTFSRLAQSTQYVKHLREVKLEFAIDEGCRLEDLQAFQLEKLNLNGCQKIPPQALSRLLSKLRNLKHLELYWILKVDDALLVGMAAYNAQLEYLSLSGCQHITDEGLRLLAGACQHLKYLDLTRCVRLTERGLVCLAEKCCQLQQLRLYACSQVTDGCLQAFGKLRQLQLIDLCGGNQLTDAGLMGLAACHELRSVSLTWCIQLTDVGVCHMVHSNPGLELLSLHGNQNITDASIKALGEHCKAALRTLDVNGCTGIRRKSREQLLAVLPNLQTFVVHT